MKSTAAILMLFGLIPTAAFAQDWKAYQYPDAGVAVQFPAPPVEEKSTYRTATGASLPMMRYIVRQDGIVYSLRIVDFSSINADGTATIAEAEKSFGVSGKVTVAIDARVNAQHGRELSVSGTDGSRSSVALFFTDKHLYLLVGEASPPNAIAKSSNTIRFQESLQFVGANAGFGGFGRFGNSGDGRFRGGANPQALAACVGKSAGDTVQLDLPEGPVPAMCTLVARPIARPTAGDR